jgi:excinuclease ABC subunit B
VPAVAEDRIEYGDESIVSKLEEEMKGAADKLDFERAAELRDRIKAIKNKQIEMGIKT